MRLKLVHTFEILPAMSEMTPSRTLAVGERGVISLEELPDGRVLVTSRGGRVFRLGPANVAWAELLPSSPILPESAVVGDSVGGLTASPSPPEAVAPSGGLNSDQSGVAQALVEHSAVNAVDEGSNPSPGATSGGPAKSRGNWRKGRKG